MYGFVLVATRWCWSRYSSSTRAEEEEAIGLQSGSCFLRAERHLHQTGICSHIRVSWLLCFTVLLNFFFFFFTWTRWIWISSASLPVPFSLCNIYFCLMSMSSSRVLPPQWLPCLLPRSWMQMRVAQCSFGHPTNKSESCWLHMSVRDCHLSSFVSYACSIQKFGSACIFAFFGFPFSPPHHLPLPS